MSKIDAARLAHIRVECEKWRATNPEWVESWDNVFLLGIIDRLLAEGKQTLGAGEKRELL